MGIGLSDKSNVWRDKTIYILISLYLIEAGPTLVVVVFSSFSVLHVLTFDTSILHLNMAYLIMIIAVWIFQLNISYLYGID